MSSAQEVLTGKWAGTGLGLRPGGTGKVESKEDWTLSELTSTPHRESLVPVAGSTEEAHDGWLLFPADTTTVKYHHSS
jgi:hypothetical protein